MLMKILYIGLGFIYAVVLTAVIYCIGARFGENNIPIATHYMINWVWVLVIPPFIVAILEKVKVMLSFDEDVSIVGLLMEAFSMVIPSIFRAIAYGVVIAVVGVAAKYFMDMPFIDQAIRAWPVELMDVGLL